jgi:hypothetical protein
MTYEDLSDFEKKMGAFSDRIGVIVGLELGDKISPEEAYQMIKEEYKELKQLRKVEKKTWVNDTEVDM